MTDVVISKRFPSISKVVEEDDCEGDVNELVWLGLMNRLLSAHELGLGSHTGRKGATKALGGATERFLDEPEMVEVCELLHHKIWTKTEFLRKGSFT